jgi:dihydroneopterin aldolase/2-amino-4-hydroxy-6-hydroxymethyldihydropteridine diphosphokinase
VSTLYIKDLIIEARHGVHDYEKRTPQRFQVSVELTLDLTGAAHSDNLDDSLDWSLLRDEITGIVRDNSFNLMERLAQVIAEAMLEHQGVKEAIVTIDKLNAFPSGVPGVRLIKQARADN